MQRQQFWISDTGTRLPEQSADPTRKEKSAPTEQETAFRKISIVDLGLFQRSPLDRWIGWANISPADLHDGDQVSLSHVYFVGYPFLGFICVFPALYTGTYQASKQVYQWSPRATQAGSCYREEGETPNSLLFLLGLRILNHFLEEVARRAFLVWAI